MANTQLKGGFRDILDLYARVENHLEDKRMKEMENHGADVYIGSVILDKDKAGNGPNQRKMDSVLEFPRNRSTFGRPRLRGSNYVV